jgi:hypothetical protein
MCFRYLWLEKSEIINRDCDYCKKYLHDQNGVHITNGKPLLRPKGNKPDCLKCPKKYIGSGWIPDNRRLFNQYRFAKTTGVLPRPGTMLDQEAQFTFWFNELTDLENNFRYQKHQNDNYEFLAKIFGCKTS